MPTVYLLYARAAGLPDPADPEADYRESTYDPAYAEAWVADHSGPGLRAWAKAVESETGWFGLERLAARRQRRR